MNDQLSSTNIVNNPEEAIEQFVGEQFIDWAKHYVKQAMHADQILQKIASAQQKPEKIKKFLTQEYLANQAFFGSKEGDPGFLRFAIANLSESDDPAAESALGILEKKRQDELAHNFPSRESWLRLLKAVGATEDDLSDVSPKDPTRTYIAELSDVYSNSDWQTAMGAMAAYDIVVAEEYAALIQMLKANTQLSDKDLEALSVVSTDQNKQISTSAHLLDKIVFDLDNKQLVLEGIKKQVELRMDFLKGLVPLLAP